MIYKDIPGWTDFSVEAVYNNLVFYLPKQKCKVFEIGCWLGRSTVMLAELIKRYGKDCEIYAIDTWRGTPDEPEHERLIAEMGGPDAFYEKFLKNIEPFSDIIRPIRSASVDAISKFNDREFDWGFIDGGHTYKDVKGDILASLPKIKNFGILAGHDADSLDVQQALDELFNRSNWTKNYNCWTYQV